MPDKPTESRLSIPPLALVLALTSLVTLIISASLLPNEGGYESARSYMAAITSWVLLLVLALVVAAVTWIAARRRRRAYTTALCTVLGLGCVFAAWHTTGSVRLRSQFSAMEGLLEEAQANPDGITPALLEKYGSRIPAHYEARFRSTNEAIDRVNAAEEAFTIARTKTLELGGSLASTLKSREDADLHAAVAARERTAGQLLLKELQNSPTLVYDAVRNAGGSEQAAQDAKNATSLAVRDRLMLSTARVARAEAYETMVTFMRDHWGEWEWQDADRRVVFSSTDTMAAYATIRDQFLSASAAAREAEK